MMMDLVLIGSSKLGRYDVNKERDDDADDDSYDEKSHDLCNY